MAVILSPAEYLHLLKCPSCSHGLAWKEERAACKGCAREYPARNGVLEFVRPSELDSEKAREHKAHDYELTEETIAHYAAKDKWSSFYAHFSDKKIGLLLQAIEATGCREFFSLGVGTGFELKQILSRRRFDAIYASDLSFSAVSIIPHTLSGFDARVGLFTSDLDHCPAGEKDMPVVIYEALHHTGDMHVTIERLLKEGYRDVIFVEPSTNLVVKILSKMGLAEREEYSGLKPKWLDLKKLKALSRRYGYSAEVTTLWEVPEEYFRRLWRRGGAPERAFLSMVDAVSWATDLVKAGSFSVVKMRRR